MGAVVTCVIGPLHRATCSWLLDCMHIGSKVSVEGKLKF